MKLQGRFVGADNSKFRGCILEKNEEPVEYDVIGKYCSHNQKYILLFILGDVCQFKMAEIGRIICLNSELTEYELKEGYYVLSLIRGKLVYELLKNDKYLNNPVYLNKDKLETFIRCMEKIMKTNHDTDYEIIKEISVHMGITPNQVYEYISVINSVDVF